MKKVYLCGVVVRILIYYSIDQKTILGLQTEILTIISQKHKLTLIVWFLCGVVVKVSIHKTISKKWSLLVHVKEDGQPEF